MQERIIELSWIPKCQKSMVSIEVLYPFWFTQNRRYEIQFPRNFIPNPFQYKRTKDVKFNFTKFYFKLKVEFDNKIYAMKIFTLIFSILFSPFYIYIYILYQSAEWTKNIYLKKKKCLRWRTMRADIKYKSFIRSTFLAVIIDQRCDFERSLDVFRVTRVPYVHEYWILTWIV